MTKYENNDLYDHYVTKIHRQHATIALHTQLYKRHFTYCRNIAEGRDITILENLESLGIDSTKWVSENFEKKCMRFCAFWLYS